MGKIVVETVSSGPYAAASQTTFAVDFQSAGDDEILVTLDGVEQPSNLYVFNRDDDGTGEVIFHSPVTGEVYVHSDPFFTQLTEFQRHGAFYPDQLNDPLNRAAQRDLWLRKRLESSMQRPDDWSPGQYIALDADGDPIGSSGTGADAGLRTDMAADNGSLLIKHKNSRANSYARSIAQQSRFGAFDDDSNVIHYIDDDLDADLLAGTNVADLRTFLQNGLDNGMARLAFPAGLKYRCNSTIFLDHGQVLKGLQGLAGNVNMTAPADQAARSAILEGRPGAADTLIMVKPDAGAPFNGEGASVEDLIIDMDRPDCIPIAFLASYANRIERVGIRGTCEWAAVLDYTYVVDVIQLNTAGASMRRGALFLGANTNHVTVDRLHTSGSYPYDNAIPNVGVAVAGGYGHSVKRSLFQGLTIGCDVRAGTGHEFLGNYFENTVMMMRWGIDGGSTSPTHCRTSGGIWESVVPAHPQYASRGPGIYLASGFGLKFEDFRFALSHAADANTWPIVLGGFGTTYYAELSNIGVLGARLLDEIARTAGGHNWALTYKGPVEATLDHGDTGILMKASDDYGSNHQIVTVDTAGAITSTTNWQPPETATVSPLLGTAFSTPVVP